MKLGQYIHNNWNDFIVICRGDYTLFHGRGGELWNLLTCYFLDKEVITTAHSDVEAKTYVEIKE